MEQIPQILTKEMLENFKMNKESIMLDERNKKSIENIEDLVLVHKTKYCPKGCIKSQRDVPEAMTDTFTPILGKNYKIKIKHERNTVHFTINGEVTNHSFGNFSDSKYIVIVPRFKN